MFSLRDQKWFNEIFEFFCVHAISKHHTVVIDNIQYILFIDLLIAWWGDKFSCVHTISKHPVHSSVLLHYIGFHFYFVSRRIRQDSSSLVDSRIDEIALPAPFVVANGRWMLLGVVVVVSVVVIDARISDAFIDLRWLPTPSRNAPIE
jgi:hypothetical protein